MTATLVTYEEAERLIGVPTLLEPRPNATNIRNLEEALFDALEGIPSTQSEEYGYKGIAQQRPEYALDVATPWVDFPDPGHHRVANGTLTTVQQRDAKVVFKAATIVHTSQTNVKSAIIGSLNRAVPTRYKRTKWHQHCQLQDKPVHLRDPCRSTRHRTEIVGYIVASQRYAQSTPNNFVAVRSCTIVIYYPTICPTQLGCARVVGHNAMCNCLHYSVANTRPTVYAHNIPTLCPHYTHL